MPLVALYCVRAGDGERSAELALCTEKIPTFSGATHSGVNEESVGALHIGADTAREFRVRRRECSG